MEGRLSPSGCECRPTTFAPGGSNRSGYRFGLAGGRHTGALELGLGLTDARSEQLLAWRRAEEARTGLAFGLDVEAAREESVGAEAGHRRGLGFVWRLASARHQAFEVRLGDARLSGSWRLVFRIEDGDAVDVDLIDYH